MFQESSGKKSNVKTDDLFRFRMLSDPRVSPDGSKLAYVNTIMDRQKDTYLNTIHTINLQDLTTTQLSMDGNETSPRWSPDGVKILYTQNIQGGTKLISKTRNKEKQNITTVKTGVIDPKWSPDGSKILYTALIKDEQHSSDVKIIDRIKYKYDGVGFLNGRRRRLFVLDANGESPRRLTSGEFDVDSAEWLPSGDVVFISNLRSDADMTTEKSIYKLNLDEPEDIVQLTDGPRVITGLRPSLDGKQIVYVGHNYKSRLWSNQDIWLVSSHGGESINLTESFDQDIGYKLSCDVRRNSPNSNPQWSPDGKYIYFNSTFWGTVRLYRVPVVGGAVDQVLGEIDHSVEAWSIGGVKDQTFVAYNVVQATSPVELWVWKPDTNEKRQLTFLNREYLDSRRIMDHERFVFQSSGGHDVEGWLIRPPIFQEGERYPMILFIRGGSAGCWGYGFMHQFQVLAAQGWVVLFVNQWGNGGYDESFQGEASGHYGEQEYRDLMDAVDNVLDICNFIDVDRLGVTGGSQGGFLTNWIISHSDRFKAAVTQRCVSNWHSFYGTSDIGWTFGKYDMEGTPWRDEDKYLSMSPIRHAANVKAPTLVIHADEDYRCSLEQAEQWYTALKVLGVPTRLVIFPGEHHGLSRSGKPRHREERIDLIVDWFEKYL
jgi:dipeptidyl aminopeptidase/acylaminoacyl peptidase